MLIQGIVPNGKKDMKFAEVDTNIWACAIFYGKFNLLENLSD